MCNKPQAIIGPLPSQNWNMQSSSTGLRPLVRFSGGTIPQLKMANLLSNKKHHGQHLLDKCRRSESTVVGLSPNSSSGAMDSALNFQKREANQRLQVQIPPESIFMSVEDGLGNHGDYEGHINSPLLIYTQINKEVPIQV